MGQRDLSGAVAARARGAYERGRLRDAIVAAWPVLLAILIALRLGHSIAWIAAIGTALLVAVVALRWRGREIGRGVGPGLMAGIAPLIIPALTVNTLNTCSAVSCADNCALWCRLSCVGAGIVAGALVGFRAANVGPGWLRFLVSAIAVAAATGAMGCLLGGSVGVAGMLLGFAAGAIPVVALLPRTA